MLRFQKWDAYRVYLILEFMTAFSLTTCWTMASLYFIREVGLNPLQLVLVGTALEVSAFLLEVPTGIVADVYSRRLSIIIGCLLLGSGFLIVGLFPVYALILFSQLVTGAGYTFISGAMAAWLADEIGEERAGKADLRASQVGGVAGILAIIFSTGLATVYLSLPIQVGALLMLVTAFFAMLFMPEAGFTPTPKAEREGFRAMTRTFSEGVKVVRGRPVLMTLLVIGVLFGAYSEGFDRLWQYHVLNNFTLPLFGEVSEPVWFGTIGVIGSIIGLLFVEVTRRRVEMTDPRSLARTLVVVNILLIACAATFAFARNFTVAIAAFWMIGPLRGLNGPLQMSWINLGLDSKVRATVNSMTAQSDAIGQMLGGPGVGWIGQQFGVRVALGLGAVILSPVVVLFARTLRGSEAVVVASSTETAAGD
ncbi:MAG: MFS transporter [bacterium]|nr:MFS transporter [bacterium]